MRRRPSGSTGVCPLTAMAELSDRDRTILTLAGQGLGEGELANRLLELGMSRTAFDLRLSRLLAGRDALEADPLTVNRLNRLAGAAARIRQGGRPR